MKTGLNKSIATLREWFQNKQIILYRPQKKVLSIIKLPQSDFEAQ